MLEFSGRLESVRRNDRRPAARSVIEAGEVVVLLGRVAAAKRRFCGWSPGSCRRQAGRSSSNRFRLNSQTIGAVRRKLGYVIQEGGLFPHLTGLENVTLMPGTKAGPGKRSSERLVSWSR